MRPLRFFTLGARLWREASVLLFEATAEVEIARGHAPPLLVDVSQLLVPKSCGASAFDGGPSDRARVLATLSTGESLTQVAHELLDLLERCATQRQRVVFACGCWMDGRCVRHMVADEILRLSHARGVSATVEEWPGGAPRVLEVVLTEDGLAGVLRGALSVPVPMKLADMVGLPWGSLVRARAAEDAGRTATFVSGPAQPASSTAVRLPVYARAVEPEDRLADLVHSLRRDLMVERSSSG